MEDERDRHERDQVPRVPGREQRDSGAERRLAEPRDKVRLERLARRDDLEKRRADRQVDDGERHQRPEVAEQLELARVSAGEEECIAAGESRQRRRGGFEGDRSPGAVAEAADAERRAPSDEGSRPGAEHDRRGDMQRGCDPERLEIARLAAADPVGVLDQLGHDQRRREKGQDRPVGAAEQLQRGHAERGEAERDHGGVRGQRAHGPGYRRNPRFSFKEPSRMAPRRRGLITRGALGCGGP